MVLNPIVSGDAAPQLASMAVSVMVGYRQRHTPVDLDELFGALNLFEQIVLHHAVAM